MSVKLTGGARASEVDVASLEKSLGGKLPRAVADFFRQHDGAKPENNSFRIGERNESAVREFILVREIEDERKCLGNLPRGAFPIATDNCGNYVLVNIDTGGAVYFWDHELGETILLSQDFSSFLALLEPFDINSVELRPGQVKRVWIDPDFLKSLKK